MTGSSSGACGGSSQHVKQQLEKARHALHRWEHYALDIPSTGTCNCPYDCTCNESRKSAHAKKLTANGNTDAKTPTSEQAAIIGCPLVPATSVRVLAYAGTGKTTTMIEFCMNQTQQPCREGREGSKVRPKILFGMFNKGMMEETQSRFADIVSKLGCSPDVTVKTLNSVAHLWYQKERIKMGLPFDPKKDLRELNSEAVQDSIGEAALLQVMATLQVPDKFKLRFCKNIVAVLNAFLYSDKNDWGRPGIEIRWPGAVWKWHQDCQEKEKNKISADPFNQYQAYAIDIWERMKGGQLPMTHDGYVKLWALAGAPILYRDHIHQKKEERYDIIIVDEAQDQSACQSKAFRPQTKPSPCSVYTQHHPGSMLMLVGDPYQRIYGFRGAMAGSMDFKSDRTFHLTVSFRFGEEVAMVANAVLEVDGLPKKSLMGSGRRKQSRLVDLSLAPEVEASPDYDSECIELSQEDYFEIDNLTRVEIDMTEASDEEQDEQEEKGKEKEESGGMQRAKDAIKEEEKEEDGIVHGLDDEEGNASDVAGGGDVAGGHADNGEDGDAVRAANAAMAARAPGAVPVPTLTIIARSNVSVYQAYFEQVMLGNNANLAGKEFSEKNLKEHFKNFENLHPLWLRRKPEGDTLDVGLNAIFGPTNPLDDALFAQHPVPRGARSRSSQGSSYKYKKKLYHTWEELSAWANDNDDDKLEMAMLVVHTMGTELPACINRARQQFAQLAADKKAGKPEVEARITITTVHQAKGMEWDNVQLTDDFGNPKNLHFWLEKGRKKRRALLGQARGWKVPDEDLRGISDSQQESLNLLYVALSRARLRLSINPLLHYHLAMMHPPHPTLLPQSNHSQQSTDLCSLACAFQHPCAHSPASEAPMPPPACSDPNCTKASATPMLWAVPAEQAKTTYARDGTLLDTWLCCLDCLERNDLGKIMAQSIITWVLEEEKAEDADS